MKPTSELRAMTTTARLTRRFGEHVFSLEIPCRYVEGNPFVSADDVRRFEDYVAEQIRAHGLEHQHDAARFLVSLEKRTSAS